MAIKGDFKDINITDIIQLIARDRKSGCLLVKKKEDTIKIYFFEGKILFVDNQSKENIIGNRLVKAGIITKENLQQIQKEQKKSGKPVYELMIKMDYVDFDTTRNFLLNQIIEDIYSVFLWTEGYYQFDILNDIPYKNFKIEIDPDSLLLDAARVLDEWKEAKKRIVSGEVILEKKELEEKIIDKFSPEEVSIYELINGDFTVDEIIEQCLISMYDAYLILSNFIESGLICKQTKRPTQRQKLLFDLNLPYIHWEGLLHNLIMLSILLLLIFYGYSNISFMKRLWNRMTDHAIFLSDTSRPSPSSMADTFYMLEYGPWPEEDLGNVK